MPAKHIQVARDSGMDAGMEAFLAAPSSKLSPNYATIVGNGRRGQASMLKHYCSVFGTTVERTRPSKGSNTVLTERVIDDKQAILEAIADRLGLDVDTLASLTIGSEDDEEHSIRVEADALVTSPEFLTRDVAWALLGASIERPAVANRAEAASNGQMWRVNSDGLLSAEEVARLNALAAS